MCLCILLVGCGRNMTMPVDTEHSGEILMNIHCASCHLLPKPENLDKTTWKSYILPRMGYMLGFRDQPDSSLIAFKDYGMGKKLGEKSPYLVNKTPKLSYNDWQRLQDYILDHAPNKLFGERPKIMDYTDLFEGKKVEMPFDRPATMLTAFVSPGHLISTDSNRGGILMHYNEKLELYKYDSLGINIVQAQKHDDTYWLTHMGLSFEATDDPNGFISNYFEDEKKPLVKVIENLTRPVHVAYGDLTGNGDIELVISEFGKWTGKLSWWKKINGKYERTDLMDMPGAIRSEIIDLNNDGKNDVVALFGQGDEAIYVFHNQGNGKFLTEKILSFPPTYGSTYFTMVDYNKDGFKDIIYTAGDNGDYPFIPKPYHGIRIFLNNGRNQFEESLFIPLYGVYKTIFGDFDRDGDQDFVAISYFPNHQDESFVFLENDGVENFTPKLINNKVSGRYLTMDSMDFDSDGDEDLVLGSYDWGQNSYNKGYIVPLVYLKNTSID